MGNICCVDQLEDIYELNNPNDWDIEDKRLDYLNSKTLIWMKKETLKAKCKVDIDFTLPDDMKGVKSKKYFGNQLPSTEPNFIDPFFKPEEGSIIYVDMTKDASKEITKDEIDSIKGLVWRRPAEIFRDNYNLFKGIEADDIKQGILGNCYFLSSIAAIAEFKERIENVFVEKSLSKNNQYQVKLIIQGKPKIVIVDDYIPCLKNSKKAAFTHCRGADNEIWVSLIEKAWAKINGSYAMTIAGLPSEGMSTLTEAPTVTYIHKKYSTDQIWKILYDSDKKDYIICTCTRGDAGLDGVSIDSVGLVPGHAYTIISLHEYKDLKLIKIRNPWGSFEWKGDYSDSSNLWNSDLKKFVNYVNSDDGTFFMKFTDFLNFFPYSFICKYEKSYFYDYKKFSQVPEESLVSCKIVITKPTNIMINLHQKSERMKNKIPNYHLNMSRIIICKFEKGKRHCYTYVASNASKNEKLHIELEALAPGEYHIFSHVNWPFQDYNNTYVISTYADNLAEIQDLTSEDVPEDFAHLIFYSYLEQKEKSSLLKPDLKFISSYGDNDLGFYMLLFNNTSKTDSYTIEFDSVLNKNVRLSTQHPNNKYISATGDSKQYSMKFTIEPETDYLVLYELLDEFWLSKLKIGSFSITTSKGQKTDLYKGLIRHNVKKIKKNPTEMNNLFYGELESNQEAFLVFMNDSESKMRVKVAIKTTDNLKPLENSQVLKIDTHDFGYIRLTKEEVGKPIDFSFEYSAKKLII